MIPRLWLLKDMTDDKKYFITLESKGVVIFGDNGKGYIIGISKICITPSIYIENILLVDDLEHNY